MFLVVKSLQPFYINFVIVLILMTSYIANAFLESVPNDFVSPGVLNTNSNVPKIIHHDPKQSYFINLLRVAKVEALSCLIAVKDVSKNPNNDGNEIILPVQSLSKAIEQLGTFLSDDMPTLKNPNNTGEFFLLMQEVNHICVLLSLIPKNTSQYIPCSYAGEHLAKTVQRKALPIYSKVLSLDCITEESFTGQYFLPFIYARTLYTGDEAKNGITIYKDPEKVNKITENTKTGLNFFAKFKTSHLLKYMNGYSLVWYYNMSPFILKLLHKRIEEENTWMWYPIAFLCTKFNELWYHDKEGNNSKHNDKKDDFNPKILEIDELLRTFINDKKYPYSFNLINLLSLQFFEMPGAVSSYVFGKLPAYKLEREHFTNEADYQLYLFVSAPEYKLEPGCPRISSYEANKHFVQYYINHTLTPALKDLQEKTNKDCPYVFTNEDILYFQSAYQYCVLILYAEICDSIWRNNTGEDLWPLNNGSRARFAGFSPETINNLAYIYNIFTKAQNIPSGN
ncbi:hypothetical protein EKK58_03970 [Candidatus Dependentiae bacterium]|nr:MAG: hypothetical protein EKK58_03970 [Candidatus Dependentiae bacterium]